MQAVPRLVLSALRGGSGKTTLAIGITAAWRGRGRRIAVFKKGPDFIDAGWLAASSGRQCYNLDPFLMEEGIIARSFAGHSGGADAAIIEGNRGLYDGVDERGTYSTARLAKLLASPVVLIVDCTKVSGTVGALVLGCREYDRDVALRGVILNNVSSERHGTVVRNAVEQNAGVPVVGTVPRLRRGEFPERHMGLTPFQEHPDVGGAIAASAALAERHLDLDALWKIATSAERTVLPEPSARTEATPREAITIGVIQDSAFQFYYPDNLEALEREGARLTVINALTDRALPELDGLYIGGGFPETHAARLADNRTFCASVRDAVENGLPVYAECGGLIYLGRSLRVGGADHPMVSVFPADFVLEQRPQAHGYTVAEVTADNPFFEKGTVLKGHEFHYSRIVNAGELPAGALVMRRGSGVNGKADGILYRNVFAAYSHLHALGSPEWARGMVRAAREHCERKGRVER
jgi:cobyrinic acid a,c-diamide synthase